MVIFCRGERLRWHGAALFGALAAVLIVGAPPPANAGFFDLLFGGSQEQAAPPHVTGYVQPAAPSAPSVRHVTAYAEPAAPSVAPENRGGTGRFVAFCVRLCDGQHFPLAHVANATPVDTCKAMCPASKTKVFFGSQIDQAVAKDGARYVNLDNAFVYREHFVANCGCNGKDAFGLAQFDLASDPTLRPGDIVATKTGFAAYGGKRGGQSAEFTPIDVRTMTAELNAGFSGVRLGRQGKEPAVADEAPGIIVQQPRADGQAVR